MKILYGILLLTSPLSLNAMTPDVTKWQEICKDPQEKQQLVTMYKDFCHKRLRNNIPWVVGSLAPFALKTVRCNPIVGGLAGLFVARQAFVVGGYSTRNDAAKQDRLDYLNLDVLEQLGNPYVEENQHVFHTVKYTDSYFKTILRRSGPDCAFDFVETDDVNGIKKALSGNYKDSRKFIGKFTESPMTLYRQGSWSVEMKVKSMIQSIKNTNQ